LCLFLSNHNANSGTGILQGNDNFRPYTYPSQNFHADEQNLSLGHDIVHSCQLKVSLAVETAAIQPKPACAGYKIFYLWLVRAGGLPFGNADANVFIAANSIRLGLS